ncbi:MAG: prepilin peptidase [bacterium]
MNYLLYFIVGAFIGSFLNVCIHRLPRGQSIITPRSHCPGCQHTLSVLDLLPILSYLFLLGKCRYCHLAISGRYPLVELVSGIFFAVNAFVFTLPIDLASSLIFCSLLIAIFFIDFEQLVIPDALSYGGILLGLFFGLFRGEFVDSLLGGILGFSLLYFVGVVGKLLFKKQAMGEGDYFMAALLGTFLGWQGVLVALFLAYLASGFVTLPLLLLKRVKIDQAIPFAPALAIGGLATLYFGDFILHWYLSFLL